MASLALLTFRHIPRRGTTACSPRLFQRRWARVLDVRYLATHGAQERVMNKYREKLDQKAKQ